MALGISFTTQGLSSRASMCGKIAAGTSTHMLVCARRVSLQRPYDPSTGAKRGKQKSSRTLHTGTATPVKLRDHGLDNPQLGRSLSGAARSPLKILRLSETSLESANDTLQSLASLGFPPAGGLVSATPILVQCSDKLDDTFLKLTGSEMMGGHSASQRLQPYSVSLVVFRAQSM